MTTTATRDPRLAGYGPTPGAVDFLTALISDRAWDADADLARRVGIVQRQLAGGTLDAAVCSRAIDVLKLLPFRPAPALPDVPDARYALGTATDHRLYRKRTDEHTGRVYVDRIATSAKVSRDRGPDTMPAGTATPVRGAEVARVLTAIAADVAGARKLYSEVTNRCSECGRPLYDPVSVAANYGPDCREKLGIRIPKVRRPTVDDQLNALGW